MPSGGTSTLLYIPDDALMTFTIHLSAIQKSGSAGTVGDSYVEVISGGAKNVAGTGALVGTTTQVHQSNDAGAALWVVAVDVVIAFTQPHLRIRVTGEVDKNIRWTTTIYWNETRY